MLINSTNQIDYVLGENNEKKETNKNYNNNRYKNLKHEEGDSSNAINFNEYENEEDLDLSTNNIKSSEYNDNNRIKEEHNQFFEPKTKSKLLNYLIDKLFLNISKILKFIGPLFCLFIINFFFYTYFSILKNIFPFWYNYFFSYENHKFFYILYKLLISLELFLTLSNDILSIIVKPGNISDIKKSKYYQSHNPYYSEKIQFPFCFIKNNHINYNININWKKCKYCNEVKPLRTHHCALCGTCIMKMDHHCPWINNCVGQNNHRYFLLFLFHIFFYTILVIILTLPIKIYEKKTKDENSLIISKKNYDHSKINFINILVISGLFIEILFSGWYWYLAINGNTNLEFWANKTGFYLEGGINNFSLGDWKNNLYYIFGSDNLFKILFIPSLQKLPYSGLEVSKFVDEGFYIEGIY